MWSFPGAMCSMEEMEVPTPAMEKLKDLSDRSTDVFQGHPLAYWKVLPVKVIDRGGSL